MPRRLPSLNAMRAFEAAARHLNLSRAADELCVTHGAVSRQVKSLEDQLGTLLFDRKDARLALTRAGETLATTARTAFDLLETGTAQVRADANRESLTVSCWSTFMMRWLIPRLHGFTERHPDIRFQLSASCAPVDFERDPFDLAIRIQPQSLPEGVTATPLFAEALGPLCSAELLKRRPLEDPRQLVQLPLLAAKTRPTAWQEWLDLAGLAGLELPDAQDFEHTFYMLEAVIAGLGVGVAQRALVESDLRNGRLVAPFGFLPSGRSACLLYPERLAGAPGVIAFRDWLLEEVKGKVMPAPQEADA